MITVQLTPEQIDTLRMLVAGAEWAARAKTAPPAYLARLEAIWLALYDASTHSEGLANADR